MFEGRAACAPDTRCTAPDLASGCEAALQTHISQTRRCCESPPHSTTTELLIPACAKHAIGMPCRTFPQREDGVVHAVTGQAVVLNPAAGSSAR
jgi:hypothetical protein